MRGYDRKLAKYDQFFRLFPTSVETNAWGLGNQSELGFVLADIGPELGRDVRM